MTAQPDPIAFNGCTCPCHRMPGVMHMGACCYPPNVARVAPTPPTEGVAGLVKRLRTEGDFARMVEREEAAADALTYLVACKTELQAVTQAINDPRVNNTITLEDAVRQLAAERDANARDAERYRWLRAGNYSHSVACSILNDTPGGIDAAIDAALARAKEL